MNVHSAVDLLNRDAEVRSNRAFVIILQYINNSILSSLQYVKIFNKN